MKKQKNGKCCVSRTFALLTAALLLAALITTGCPGNLGDSGIKPPAGMGFVRVSIGGAEARTILPDVPDPFGEYELTFTEVDSTGGTIGSPIVVNDVIDSDNDSIALPPGYYTLEVIAYVTSEAAGDDAAEGVYFDGTDYHFEIEDAETTYISVDLELYNPATATGTGTFKSNPSLNGVSAALTIRPYPTGTAIESGYTTWPYEDDIDAGYYFVDYLVTDTASSRTATLTQILHVYQNLESVFNPSFDTSTFEITAPTYEGWADVTINSPLPLKKPTITVTYGAVPTTVDPDVPVELVIPAAATFTVSGLSSYTWYANGTAVGTANTALAVTSGTTTGFTAEGVYFINVIGTSAAADEPGPHAFNFIIKVIEPAP